MATYPKKRPKNPNPNSFIADKYIPEPSPNFLPSSKPEFLKLISVVAIAASVAFSCNFLITFFNQQPKPFCDSAIDFDDSISDYCEPCPSNAICNEGKLECARGYRKQGKLCVEDTDINAAAKKLSELVEVCVCEPYAQSLCGRTGTIWVRKDELWTYLDNHEVMANHALDEATYILAKLRAIENSRKMLETRSNAGGFEEFKCPDCLVKLYKPISCRIRQWIIEHALVLVPVCALLVGCMSILFKIRRRYYLSVRAEELYNQVCDILEENAMSSRSTNSEPWVVASWLRDYLLSPKERKDPKLWKKVEELVQEDSRLDRYPKMVKGESKVVWEWQVEGSLSSSGKRKKTNESKLKSSGGINLNPNQQIWQSKIGQPLSS